MKTVLISRNNDDTNVIIKNTSIDFTNNRNHVYNFFKYLRRRGFTIEYDPKVTKEIYSISFAKNYRLIHKKDLKATIEINSNEIRIIFFQELNTTHVNGGRYEFNKFKSMPYNIKLHYKNESNRIGKYFEKKGYEIKYTNDSSDITPEERILKSKRECWHTNKSLPLNTLDDLALHVEGRQGYNFKDANGKLIKSGELKYFYDYNKRLCCGYVYHNLNNMWWVITQSTIYHNKASFELFDYNNHPRRKVLKKEQLINKLKEVINFYVSKNDYLRCHLIQLKINETLNNEKKYHVWSIKWGKWWGANNGGYTTNKSNAGIYLHENVMKNQEYYNDGKINKIVLIE